jgi:glycosyltransferase involved in cell wall biosynthesis
MKITVISHNLSSNASMRAHRIAEAARTFAKVELIGPMEEIRGLWPALPNEPWIKAVPEKRFPGFCKSFIKLTEIADGDVLIAVKPHLGSFGVALVAAERREVPVILDLEEFDAAHAPRSDWAAKPTLMDLKRPGSAIYVSLLTKATGAAAAITASCSALARRFGGTVIPHGCLTHQFDPGSIDRDSARRTFGFEGPTVLFPGIPRGHKGLEALAQAVARVPDARLAVTCRDKDLAGPEWRRFPLNRIPLVPYSSVAALFAAADVVAIPQLDSEPARYQMPMKVFDAMAMARPIVASSVSDLPAVLEGCGRLVPPGDVDELAQAIAELLSNPAQARAVGERARIRCLEQFSMRRVGESLHEVVNHVLEPNGAATTPPSTCTGRSGQHQPRRAAPSELGTTEGETGR